MWNPHNYANTKKKLIINCKIIIILEGWNGSTFIKLHIYCISIDGNNVDAIQFLTQGNRRFKKTFNIVTKRNTMMAVQVQLY